MSRRDTRNEAQAVAARAGGRAAVASGLLSQTSTGAVAAMDRQPGAGRLAEQMRALPEPVRLQMALIAQGAASSDEALAPVIELLVDGSPAKRTAIVTAFRTNEPLREQWERTFEILRAW